MLVKIINIRVRIIPTEVTMGKIDRSHIIAQSIYHRDKGFEHIGWWCLNKTYLTDKFAALDGEFSLGGLNVDTHIA